MTRNLQYQTQQGAPRGLLASHMCCSNDLCWTKVLLVICSKYMVNTIIYLWYISNLVWSLPKYDKTRQMHQQTYPCVSWPRYINSCLWCQDRVLVCTIEKVKHTENLCAVSGGTRGVIKMKSPINTIVRGCQDCTTAFGTDSGLHLDSLLSGIVLIMNPQSD